MGAPLSFSTAVPMVTLRDGTKVPQSTLIETMEGLRKVSEDVSVLLDLVEKCRNTSFIIPNTNCFGNSNQSLLEHKLINQNRRVDGDKKRIILNAIAGEGFTLCIIDPTLVVLSNGEHISKDMLDDTMNKLKDLYQNDFPLFYELIQKCKNSEHFFTPYVDVEEMLRKLGFINEKGEVYAIKKSIVMLATNSGSIPLEIRDPTKILNSH